MTAQEEFNNTYKRDIIGKDVIVLESAESTDDVAREIAAAGMSLRILSLSRMNRQAGEGGLAEGGYLPPGSISTVR